MAVRPIPTCIAEVLDAPASIRSMSIMMLGDYLRPARPTKADCVKRAQQMAEERGLPVPSARALLDWLRAIERSQPAFCAFIRSGEMPAGASVRAVQGGRQSAAPGRASTTPTPRSAQRA